MAGGTDWEDTRNIYQGPRRFKERTISNEHNNWGEKPLGGTNSRMREAAEQRSELEDRIAKTAATEQHEENRIKRNEDSLMEKQWHPTPVLLPAKSHGRRSLVGYSPWGCEELDTTEQIHFHFSLSCFGEGNGNPLQCSCLENPRDGGAWGAAVYGVAQSLTRLKWLSSSNSNSLALGSVFVTT